MTELQPTAIVDALAALDEPDRGIVGDAYAIALALAPTAEPGLSYGMPALVLGGKGLISVQRTKTHFGVSPFSAAVVGRFADEFEPAMISRGAMRFALGTPIPTELLERIVRARVEEIQGRD